MHSGPGAKETNLRDEEVRSVRSDPSSKRSETQKWQLLVPNVHSLQHPVDPSLLPRGYPRKTSTITKPSQASPKCVEDSPMQAQDLAAFKSDLTALMTKDMIHSSLSAFASQSKSDQGGKGGVLLRSRDLSRYRALSASYSSFREGRRRIGF